MYIGEIWIMNYTSNSYVEVENSTNDRDEKLARLEVATLAIIFLITVIGNSIVLLALWIRRRYTGRKKLSRMYFFILHLSIADLITAFLSDLPQLSWDVTYRFKGGSFMCKLVKYGQTLGPYLSSYVLMATALDRHQAICYPLTYCSWTSRRSKIMVYAAWVVSLTFCIPQVTIFSFIEVTPDVYDCWATFQQKWGESTYVIWYSVSIFIIPLIVLVYTYSCICKEIWQNSESSLRPYNSYKTTTRKRKPLISRAKINTVKQTIAVIVMYIICSTPFIVGQLWAISDPNNPFLDGPVFTILMLLYSLNSCVNPWIYLAFNKELPRMLLKHYTTTRKKYRAAGAEQSPSNSSGEIQTSVLPFSRWSRVNNSERVVKFSDIACRIVKSDDCSRLFLWGSKLYLELLSIWPEYDRGYKSMASFILQILGCSFLSIGQIGFAVANSDDLNKMSYGLCMSTLSLMALFRLVILWYKSHDWKILLQMVMTRFWPYNLTNMRSKTKLIQYFDYYNLYVLFLICITLIYNGLMDLSPLFLSKRALPFDIYLPFEWTTSPTYEALYGLQIIVLGASITVFASGMVFLIYGIMLCLTSQYILLSECLRVFNQEGMHEILSEMRSICASNNEKQCDDVQEYFIRCINHHQLLLDFMCKLNDILNPLELGQLVVSSLGICFGILRLSSENLSFGDLIVSFLYMAGVISQLAVDCALGTLLYYQVIRMAFSLFTVMKNV